MSDSIYSSRNNYVYIHTKADTGEPFYVGKGTGNRAAQSKSARRNVYWQNIVEKHGFDVIIFADGLTEEQAYFTEIMVIQRLLLDGYELSNITPGGLGAGIGNKNRVGKHHTNDTKQKMSEAKIGKASKLRGRRLRTLEQKQHLSQINLGNKYALGHKHTKETKKKLSQIAKGRIFGKETKKKISDALKLVWQKRKQLTRTTDDI